MEDIAAEGFNRKTLPAALRRLIEVGFLSRQQPSTREPFVYRLHLPALVQA